MGERGGGREWRFCRMNNFNLNKPNNQEKICKNQRKADGMFRFVRFSLFCSALSFRFIRTTSASQDNLRAFLCSPSWFIHIQPLVNAGGKRFLSLVLNAKENPLPSSNLLFSLLYPLSLFLSFFPLPPPTLRWQKSQFLEILLNFCFNKFFFFFLDFWI